MGITNNIIDGFLEDEEDIFRPFDNTPKHDVRPVTPEYREFIIDWNDISS